MAKILTNSIKEFLEDIEKGSSIEILEEGKEKDELINSAKKRGILLKNSRDLGIIKTIYSFTDTANLNGAILPEKEFKKKLPGLVGKLMNVGHDRQFIVGYYIDYKYIVKENKAIAYAIFFKSAYPNLWKKTREFLKNEKLASSFEIWSPEDKTKHNEDGTYELHDMEIAGGALIYEDEENKPAFPGARVLSLARQHIGDKQLHLASKKYTQGSFVTAEGEEITTIGIPNENITVCKNCEAEIDLARVKTVKEYYQCPSCSCLLNRAGKVKYPGQDVNMKLRCPKCSNRGWMIKKRGDNKLKVECLKCEANYILERAKIEKKISDNVSLISVRNIKCPQCSRSIGLAGFSNIQIEKKITCGNCGLEFRQNPIKNSDIVKIKKITEISVEAKDKLTKSSEEGGKSMKIPKEVEKRVKEAEAAEEALKKATEEALGKETEVEDKSVEETTENKTEEAEATTEDEQTEEVESSEEAEETSEEEASDEEMYPNTASLRKAVKKIRELKTQLENATESDEETSKLRETLRKSAKRTVLAKKTIKELEEAKERNAEGVRKTVKRLMASLKENSELAEQVEEAKETYKQTVRTIVERRDELGKYADDMSDEELLDEEKYELAKLRKDNSLLKAKLDNKETNDEVAIEEAVSDDEYKRHRTAIDKAASRSLEK